MNRHLWKLSAALLVFLGLGLNTAWGQPKLKDVKLESRLLNPKVPLAAYPQGILQFTLNAKVDDKGEGEGEIILNPNTVTYTELGEVAEITTLAPIKLPCSLKFIKKVKVQGIPLPGEDDWLLYQIQSMKIIPQLTLATPSKALNHARLLIKNKNGKVVYVVELNDAMLALPPCHPGCFPAGTPVQTPQGTKPIESLGAGAVVTVVRPDGTTAPGKIQSVFVTDNVLFKVETEEGFLITTETQPLCLADGELQEAGKLQAGDRILRWHNGKPQAVKVKAVTATGRKEKVFNLILGGSEMFIAGGFLARSKPPAEAVLAAPQSPVLGLPASKK